MTEWWFEIGLYCLISCLLYTVGFKRLGHRLEPTFSSLILHLLIGLMFIPVALWFLIKGLFSFGKTK